MLDVFAKVKSPNLQGLIVWLPMVPGDSALAAADLVSAEKRLAMQAWDSRRSIGVALAKTLHLRRPAWDVYLVYGPGVEWVGETAPMPSFWMHQLGKRAGADPALRLVPAKLEYEVRKQLGEQIGPEPGTKPEEACL